MRFIRATKFEPSNIVSFIRTNNIIVSVKHCIHCAQKPKFGLFIPLIQCFSLTIIIYSSFRTVNIVNFI